MIVDLGTGDGRAVLARASAEPAAFVIGVDANAAAMAESSRRANRAPSTLGNACFLVEAVEALPGPLAGVASLVTVTFPWGSLLRGALGSDVAALRGIASIVAPAGRVEVVASVTASDRVPGLETLDASAEPPIGDAWRAVGLELCGFRPAIREDIAGLRSSWARRLGERPVWCLELQRTDWSGRIPAPGAPRSCRMSAE